MPKTLMTTKEEAGRIQSFQAKHRSDVGDGSHASRAQSAANTRVYIQGTQCIQGPQGTKGKTNKRFKRV